MQPSKQTIAQIFQAERRYVVPLFQRAYVWNLDDQWRPLWEDIERQARQLEENVDGAIATPGNHFLGAIVVQVDQIVGGRVPKTSVIDGQQRLTTFQILLAAIRDYLNEISHASAARFERLTRNPDPLREEDDYFKVWPTNADRRDFKNVLTAGSPTALRQAYNITRAVNWGLPQMAQAYMFFRECFVEYISALGEEDDPSKANMDARISAVDLALQSALQIVVIELEASDDPQIIFETLNARGQPLLPSDLIKNTVFLEAGGENAEAWYQKYWHHFDTEPVDGKPTSRFWHALTGLVRPARPHIDVFFYTFLIEQTAREVNVGQLYAEFKHWRRLERELPTERLLNLIHARSLVFRKVLLGGLHPRIDAFFSRLRSLDTISPVPFALHLLARAEKNPDLQNQVVACIADVESFLVRRLFCRKSSKNYVTIFVGLLKAVKDVPDTDIHRTTRDYLRSAPGAGPRPWPDDDTFKAGWLEHKIYVKSRADRSAMVLKAIEISEYTSLNESTPSLDNLTVEHLLPQSASTTHYPYKDVALYKDYPSEERRELLIHTIGNLTLLTQALYSTVGNGPFPNKRQFIGENSNLRINAPFRSNVATSWGENDIVDRGQALFEKAKKIWPFP